MVASELANVALPPDVGNYWRANGAAAVYGNPISEPFTDATGEVLGFGEARPGTIPYEVKDVPHVMYFNMEAEAFHGAYWHSNFGQPMSHGCINLPVAFADWLYGWTPLGTGVWIHA